MLEGVRNRLLDSKKGKKVQNGFVIISDESDNGAGGSSGTKTEKVSVLPLSLIHTFIYHVGPRHDKS